MVVPLALGAQNGKVKVRIHSSDRDVKAVHLLRGAVGIGDGICGGLQPVGLVVGGIGSLAQIQVDDMGGSKADMEGHLAVLHGQGALAVAGFVGVEHAAVGIEVRGVNAVGKRGLGVRVLRIAVPALLPAAEKQRAEHQHGQYQCQCSFHWEVPPSGKGSEAVHNRFEAPF